MQANPISDILQFGNLNQKFLQVLKLDIIFVPIKVKNWDSIINLQSKALSFIVDQDHIL